MTHGPAVIGCPTPGAHKMAPKRAITRQRPPDVIANDPRERILSGERADGETIRHEALAEEYDVSHMSVGKALKQLDAEGRVRWTRPAPCLRRISGEPGKT